MTVQLFVGKTVPAPTVGKRCYFCTLFGKGDAFSIHSQLQPDVPPIPL